MPMRASTGRPAEYRSRARSTQVRIRLSPEDREELQSRARSAGMTVQAYVEWKTLDRAIPSDLPQGRSLRRPSSDEELPLTG